RRDGDPAVRVLEVERTRKRHRAGRDQVRLPVVAERADVKCRAVRVVVVQNQLVHHTNRPPTRLLLAITTRSPAALTTVPFLWIVTLASSKPRLSPWTSISFPVVAGRQPTGIPPDRGFFSTATP